MESSTLSPIEHSAYRAGGIRSASQRGGISVEVGIWVGSGLLAILGLVQAVHSAHPFLWLAVWPAPVTLVSTIFIFLREGFHFRNGVLVLGRRTPNKKFHAKRQRKDKSGIAAKRPRPHRYA
jgi:hypothetical protein